MAFLRPFDIRYSDKQRKTRREISDKLDELSHCHARYIREIKIRVYGKREQQKLPRDHYFPAIFHVCRFQREEDYFLVRQQREYLS